jgi:hypothetical protein
MVESSQLPITYYQLPAPLDVTSNLSYVDFSLPNPRFFTETGFLGISPAKVFAVLIKHQPATATLDGIPGAIATLPFTTPSDNGFHLSGTLHPQAGIDLIFVLKNTVIQQLCLAYQTRS